MYLSKIMDSGNDLSAYLLKKHDSEITIVTAFASATQGIVDKLLSQGNKLKIIVGTINAFTDPAFIKHCAQKKEKIYGCRLIFVDKKVSTGNCT